LTLRPSLILRSFTPGLLLTTLVAAFLAAGILSLNNMLVYTPDSARYLAWANSLAQCDGYKDATEPEPTRYVVHAPLYPMLLAPAEWLFPDSVAAAKATTLVVGIVALLAMYRWLRRKTGAPSAVLGTFLLAVNPLTLLYATQVLSDLPFAVAVILFFWYGETVVLPAGDNRLREYSLVAAVVAGLFLREVGLTLMMAAAAFFLWRREYRRFALVVLVALLFYLLWFIRNEVIVAGAENPPMRNTRVFLSHYYTPNQAGLVTELAARLWSNLQVYTKLVGRLLFFPDLASRSHSLVSPGDPFVSAAMRFLSVGQYGLTLLTIGLVLLGGWVESKRSPSFALVVSFLIFYPGLIMLYPINDIRFLYPILVLMVMCWTVGLAWTVERWRTWRPSGRGGQVLAAAVVAVALVPNVAWIQSFVRNSWEYRRSPGAFYEAVSRDPVYPESFTKPLDLAARWIVAHSDSTARVLTRWKETAFWLEGRKVVDADPQITPDAFDYLIRNYGVRFVVSLVSRGGLREHEALFAQSVRYRFVTAYRIANVEVVRVLRRAQDGPLAEEISPSGPVTREDSARMDFARALALLEDGRPAVAETLLTHLGGRIGRYGAIVFHIGVAKEFADHLPEAEKLFERFRSIPQAGSYLQQAWYHQEIIARLRRAEAAATPPDRANLFYVVAVNEWEVGFRHRALQLLDRAIREDSSFYPALIFKSIFEYKLGNLRGSRRMLAFAARFAPSNLLTTSLDTALMLSDSITRLRDAGAVIPLVLHRAGVLASMSLREEAIDDLLEVLRADPSNLVALRMAADLFYAKGIDEPALRIYRQLSSIGSSNAEVAARLAALERRWR